ncbi:hybrid sensor histidine kinase/response regulator [Aspergillus mulundensis]|uniref:histidine kinase n=1 Tax=Aspergillus mulundensis TaxID=1810919 RepID=A0A3D8RXW0_9EURO|nr:hypothetical protein DSM5745_05751 [Aspergillus mulundensis]RDW78899.1 hypothetical protein DSM5745_05751 [Aspergillus mulundensis]
MSKGAYKSACDAERERLREVARYYCVVDRPSSNNHIHTLQGDDRPDHNKRLASDTALTGLARLGVLQFGCNRAFVSIIDEANQHVIAEATTSVSLNNARKHQANDGLYLGTKCLDLGWGVVPRTVGFFTNRMEPIDTENMIANETRYIVHDFTKEDAYKDRPYVVHWPFMRFYAAVPIKSPGGYVLGSYTIVDNKPRSDFGQTEIEGMQDIADAIAQHLETVRLSYCHHRTETLVKSLTTFVKEHDDFDPTESYQVTPTQSMTNIPETAEADDTKIPGTPDESRQSNPDGAEGDGYDPLGLCSPSDVTGEASSLFSKVVGSEQTEISFPHRSVERPPSASSGNCDRRDSVPQNAPAVTDTPADTQSSTKEIGNKIAKIFRRASILLRDSMDLDGVLFVDASRCNAGVVLSNDTGTWEPLPSTLSPGFLVDPYPSPAADIPGVGSLSKPSDKPCTLLGRALRETVNPGESPHDWNITERVLDDLMASFPQGQIFDLSDLPAQESSPLSDPVTALCRDLAACFPNANSVLFSPIWDWNKSRWLAGTLVWTSDIFRALGAEELHYFKAFGDSIISEVARVDWSAIQKSKSAFMSSVSHELRSPLHGILASAELLGTTALPPEQQHLVDMVESCGLTLLDTLNHLLDFSGINNLSALEDPAQGLSDAGMTSLETDFDLGDLVEEVVEVQYTGQNLPKAAIHLNQQTAPAPDHFNANADELSVIVRVEDMPTWKIHSVPGAWRRIVMNLLGNSLKWTKAGFVEVSLSKVRRKRDPLHVFALLSVTDTGAGIAPDFLRHNVFSPFAQENSLSEGLGLGLSTVRQLVGSLDGHLNVRSEVGVGTQVDIFVPVQILQSTPAPRPGLSVHRHVPEQQPVRVCLIGFNDYPGLKETPTGILPAEAKRKLAIRSCLTAILAEQRTWNIYSSESFHGTEGDVAIIEEVRFLDALKNGELPLDDPQRAGFRRIFVILNSKNPTSHHLESSRLIRVSQPFGCRKFRNAVVRVDKLLKEPQGDSLSDPIVKRPLLEHTSPQNLSVPTASLPQNVARRSPILEQSTVELTGRTTDKPVQIHEHLHLLIVDDNAINLKILATFAAKIGCTYDTASDGLIALNKYRDTSRRYDLILMDISMPVMDGIVATKEIRQFEEEQGYPRSRIMAVTGVASTDMQQRAQAAGIDEYLVKPVSLVALKKVIAAL